MGADLPDPGLVRARALRPLQVAGMAVGAALLALAALGPPWTGWASTALLPGVPGGIMLAAALRGRREGRRYRSMLVLTMAAGALALATAAAPSGLGGPVTPAVALQLLCLALSSAVLAVAWVTWRSVHRVGEEADAVVRMHDQLQGRR